MYDSRPNLIIGFHGCEEEVKNKLIKSANTIPLSEKPYDWLGHVMYFWENNYDWALQWAKDKKKRGELNIQIYRYKELCWLDRRKRR